MALDGLRGVAALVIVLFHAVGGILPGEPLFHAPLAVDLFFVLSGFVIGYAYEDKLLDGRLSFWGFAQVRLMRLYPLIVLGVLLAGGVLLSRVGFDDLDEVRNAGIAIIGGLTLTPLSMENFTPSGYVNGVYINAPEWSLFYELAINLAYAAVAPRLKSRHLVAFALVGAVGLIAMTIFGAYGDSGWDIFVSGLPRVLFSFSVGLLLYRHRSIGTWGRGGPWAVVLAALLFLVLTGPHLFVGQGMLLTLVALPLFVLVGAHLDAGPRFGALADWAGRVSYPLYIIHFPLLRLFNHFMRDSLSMTARLWALALEIPLLVALAWLALVLFDQPIRAALGRLAAARPGKPDSATATV